KLCRVRRSGPSRPRARITGPITRWLARAKSGGGTGSGSRRHWRRGSCRVPPRPAPGRAEHRNPHSDRPRTRGAPVRYRAHGSSHPPVPAPTGPGRTGAPHGPILRAIALGSRCRCCCPCHAAGSRGRLGSAWTAAIVNRHFPHNRRIKQLKNVSIAQDDALILSHRANPADGIFGNDNLISPLTTEAFIGP